MDIKTNNVIASIMALVISLGVTISPGLFENELNDYYICSLNNDIQEFKGGISGTGLSGYPYEGSRKGYKRCQVDDLKGTWIKLSDYAEENNIDPYDLVQEDDIKEKIINKRKVICTQKGCKE